MNRGHEYNGHIEDRPEELAKLAKAYLDQEAAISDVDAILIHDACDHQEWSPKRYALLFADFAKGRKYHVTHTSLDAYLADLLAQRDRITTVREGELRAAGRAHPVPQAEGFDQQWVIPGVLSSRVRLKQANHRCQTLLCSWAEPFSAFASAATGTGFAPGFLEHAWRQLMQNHAHDSIDGCSPDQVHKDMEYPFDQCRMIAEKLTVDATSRIAASVRGKVTDNELRVTVFNPLPRDFDGVTEVTLEVPTTWPGFNEFFGFEPKTGFVIHDAEGREVPYQRLGQTLNRIRQRIRPTKFPEGVMSHHIPVTLRLAIPAQGYTTLTVSAVAAGRPTRYPDEPAMATSERSMANEHLSVAIEDNGSLTLTDRHTGRVYSRLLTFEERADIGDGWYHGIAVNDQIFASTGCHADVALVHNGPMLTAFRVRTTMSVPKEFLPDGMVRSNQFVPLVLDSLISLRPGQRYLEVQTAVDNTADDHRVRVLFPSGAKTDTFLTDTAFDVVERPIALPKDNHEYRELNVETVPQQSWTAVHDAKAGLAIIADGLLETTVRDLAERPIALTLFRGTRRTVFTGGEPGGQMRGELTFRYLVMPFSGKPNRTKLCELGLRLSGGLRAVQLRKEDVDIFQDGANPAAHGRLSARRRPGGGDEPPAGRHGDGGAVVQSRHKVRHGHASSRRENRADQAGGHRPARGFRKQPAWSAHDHRRQDQGFVEAEADRHSAAAVGAQSCCARFGIHGGNRGLSPGRCETEPPTVNPRLRAGGLREPAFAQYEPTRTFRRMLGVVGHEHQSRAGLTTQAEQQLDHSGAGVLVKITGRLVGEDQPRGIHQRPRHGHALALAAG